MTHPEADLQIQVSDLLRLFEPTMDFIWFSTPNELLGSARTKGGLGRMARFKRMGLRPGVADIVIVREGKAYFLELKAHGGIMSDNQRQFREDAQGARAEYEVAFSFDEALACLRGWGIVP